METDNVIYMPVPKLTPEQRQHWQERAAYWAVVQENAERACEYADRQREDCLRMLGMLAAERGLNG